MPTLQFQSWLDTIADAFFEDRFDVYADAVNLPLMVNTRSASVVVTDQDQLQGAFNAWRDMMREQMATHFIRTAREVVSLGDGLMEGRYETRLLRETVHIIPPFDSTMTLRLEGDVWKAVTVTSGMSNTDWPITLPRVGKATPIPTSQEL